MPDISIRPPPGAGLRRLSAPLFRRALAAGVARVLAQRELLDRINVFPVPDGDTGANLSHTLRAMLGALREVRGAHLGALLERLADSALVGARGNSGAILAQYVLGFSAAAAPHRHLDLARLAEAASAGERAAYAAVSAPREGTMLSVMRAFTLELIEQARRDAVDLAAALQSALEGARRALAETPQKLAELRAAGVVDAGAKGFVEFVAGMLELLGGRGRGAPLPRAVEAPPSAPAPLEGLEPDTRFRYCCECVLVGQELAVETLREALAALPADSLVLAGSRAKLKVHGHAEDPEAFFALLARFGAVTQRKADDMQAQQRRAGAIAVVADSGADLPSALLASGAVHVVPVRVAFGEEEFLDKLALSPEAFFSRLRAERQPPRTSQPPPADFQRAFEFLLSHHQAVLGIHLSRRLSGTLQSAEAAAARVDPGRILLIDTANASAGQGLLVAYAVEALAAGLSLTETAQAVGAMVARTRSFAVLADLRHAERGGRLPRLARWLGEGIGLRPVLTNREGRLGIAGVLLGAGRLPERFAAWVGRRLAAGRDYRVLIAHADDRSAAERLRAALLRVHPGLEEPEILPLGSAIAAHAGPGALLVAAQDYLPPRELLARLPGAR